MREKDRQEWQEAIIHTKQHSKQQVEVIEQQVWNTKDAQHDTEEKLNSVSIEKGRRLDEMTNTLTTVKENQLRVQHRLEEMEQRPAIAINGNNGNKEITFDGEDSFPMEFLKESKELQETYYPAENMRWLNRHLTGEAAIWWCIVRGQVNTFQEFEDIFVEK